MSKKTQAASAAEAEQGAVQASAPAAEAPGEQVEQVTEQPPDPVAATTEQQPEPVRGRALIDLPAHGLKCGEFGTLPADVAQSLASAGEFDPKAVEA